MMMTLASVLALLGLIQGATAVVLGAMLVAPLMGPLLGAGLAVVQGNLSLRPEPPSCRSSSSSA